MNRIEERLRQLKEKNEKALITYMTAGLPDMKGTEELIRTQAEAGVDVIELGVPFSDPTADGPVIQAASFKSIQNGTTLQKIFDSMKNIRKDCDVPVVFMIYFNTLFHYGIEKFVKECINSGVDGLIIPDLPYEEQEQLTKYISEENAPILIQLVSPVSKNRIPMLLENARGFVYCVSQMGVTGKGADFHKDIKEYLGEVKKVSKLPVMMEFGISAVTDILPLKDSIDGAIAGSAFIKLMEKENYSNIAAAKYIREFKEEFNK